MALATSMQTKSYIIINFDEKLNFSFFFSLNNGKINWSTGCSHDRLPKERKKCVISKNTIIKEYFCTICIHFSSQSVTGTKGTPCTYEKYCILFFYWPFDVIWTTVFGFIVCFENFDHFLTILCALCCFFSILAIS